MSKRKAKDEKRDEYVAARITKSESDELERIAAAEDRTLSYVVAKAIREFLERRGALKRKP
jgi:predicted transcriptional regulator